MNIEALEQVIREKMSGIETFVREDVPKIIVKEAIEHFKESFDKEAFAGGGEPWPEVERRKPGSPWYGFAYKEPNNFSEESTTNKILHGRSSDGLKDAFYSRIEPGQVVVSNEKPYAAIHNFGGPAKIFGKTPFVMKQRQFMSHSPELQLRIDEKIYREMIKILK